MDDYRMEKTLHGENGLQRPSFSVFVVRPAAAAAAGHTDDVVAVDLGDVEVVFAAETRLHKGGLRFSRVRCLRLRPESLDLGHSLPFSAAAQFFDDDVVFHKDLL